MRIVDCALATDGGTQVIVLELDDGENLMIGLLENWLDQTQGFIRREALMVADPATLKNQDRLDRFALEFIVEVRGREVNDRSGRN